jgi:hypothetical protein
MNSFRRPVLSSAISNHCVPTAWPVSDSDTHPSTTLRAETKWRIESYYFSYYFNMDYYFFYYSSYYFSIISLIFILFPIISGWSHPNDWGFQAQILVLCSGKRLINDQEDQQGVQMSKRARFIKKSQQVLAL